MGIKLDYAQAKAEADLHRYLESGHQNAPDALRAAICYLKTLTAGLIAEHLRPDSPLPQTAVADFRSATTKATEYLWKSEFFTVAFFCDCDFSPTDFSTGVYFELSQLWDHAVTEFWSQRAEYFAKLAGGAVPATVASTGNAINRRGAEVITGSAPLSLPAREEPDAARADEGAARPDFPRRAAWLQERLAERAWNRNDPLRQRGPDPKTFDKVLRGEPVREDVLEKLAKALSEKHAIVALLDIPQD